MLIKIDLSQIYSMDGKVILGNKYRRAEGNLFETGYTAVTVATGAKGSTVYQTSDIESPDYRRFYKLVSMGSVGRPETYSTSTWGLKIFYDTIRCVIQHSTSDPVMETNTSDFYTDIKTTSTNERLTHSAYAIPPTNWTRPSGPVSGGSTGTASMYNDAVASLLGNAAMSVVEADYYNAIVDVSVITKVEVWENNKDSTGGPLSYFDPFDGGSVKSTHNLQTYSFSVFNNTFIVDSNPYELGSQEKKYVYKYPDNWLITEMSTYTKDGTAKPLIENLFQNIISNYRNGKQVVNLSISEGDYKDADNNNLSNHIFEVGQYIKLYDDMTPLIYYKLSNECKIFEITECEYIDEHWNLVVKEVAKVESSQ